jgi:hypothetical protein
MTTGPDEATGAGVAPDAESEPSLPDETATETTMPGDTGFDAADNLFDDTDTAIPLEPDAGALPPADGALPPTDGTGATPAPGTDGVVPPGADAPDDAAAPLDDLFDNPPAETPAGAPDADAPVDPNELFDLDDGAAVPSDSSLLPTASDNGAATDNPPLEADELDQPPVDEAGDDLFDMPAEDENDGNNDGSLDDLFSRADRRLDQEPPRSSLTSVQVGPESSSAARLPLRTWVDNTGTYSTRARLVEIGRTYIKLLKDNGRPSTVPMSRLSNEDFAYVHAIAKRLGSQSANPLVASK